jgi:hypothetical protein
MQFVSSEVFTFSGDATSRLGTYQVILSGAGHGLGGAVHRLHRDAGRISWLSGVSRCLEGTSRARGLAAPLVDERHSRPMLSVIVPWERDRCPGGGASFHGDAVAIEMPNDPGFRPTVR